MVSSLPVTLFILSSAFILRNISASVQSEISAPKNDMGSGIKLEEFAETKTSGFNENEPYNWLFQLEDEWEEFNDILKKDKDIWFEERNDEWNDWVKTILDKWITYNEKINATYKTYSLQKSESWSRDEWESWADKEWKKVMDKDWQKWISACKRSLNNMVDTRWVNWTNNKMIEWLMSSLKTPGNTDMDISENEEIPNPEDIDVFLGWDDTIFKQNVEWENWVRSKEKFIKNLKNENWGHWKDNKYNLFNEIRKSFLMKWLNDNGFNSSTNE
ncbi:tryptophan-rich antigen [Plasmodium ovale]|uniref:Tryptophan-rich antigen n=1 Tax=Plasmodium ovale TaxID=36330 RepID=A0A1C3KNK5_PLAOA|nr:tryptophan-rich antigen [Plasmodium ovale]